MNRHADEKKTIKVKTQVAGVTNDVIFDRNYTVYTNYFYDTSVIFSNFIITYREPFTGPT